MSEVSPRPSDPPRAARRAACRSTCTARSRARRSSSKLVGLSVFMCRSFPSPFSSSESSTSEPPAPPSPSGARTFRPLSRSRLRCMSRRSRCLWRSTEWWFLFSFLFFPRRVSRPRRSPPFPPFPSSSSSSPYDVRPEPTHASLNCRWSLAISTSRCSSSPTRRHHFREFSPRPSRTSSHRANAARAVKGSPCGDSKSNRASRPWLAALPGFCENGDLTASAAASDVAGPVRPNNDASTRSFPALTSTGRLARSAPSGVSVSVAVNAPCSCES